MYLKHDFAEPLIFDLSPEDALVKLCEGHSLSSAEAQRLFEELVAGRLSEPAIAAMLVALRLKGETAEEMIGGDGAGSSNVSTAVAFTAAACGLPVAKHGNRSVASRCGSADVLEHLGARLDVSAEVSRRALDETGVCFLFAPLYHPGLRHAGPARRALKVRTIMNMLGPCVNPAEPQAQLLGVADPSLLDPIARTLAALGTKAALVVHGSGLDEVALHGPTEAVRIGDGRCERIVITPEEVGLARAPVKALKGGAPEENAERLKALLMGYASRAEADSVALNAGALLLTAGICRSLREGVDLAAQAIASGAAHGRLRAFMDATHA